MTGKKDLEQRKKDAGGKILLSKGFADLVKNDTSEFLS